MKIKLDAIHLRCSHLRVKKSENSLKVHFVNKIIKFWLVFFRNIENTSTTCTYILLMILRQIYLFL